MKYFIKQVFLIGLTFAITLQVVEWFLEIKANQWVIDDIPYVVKDGLRTFKPDIDTVVTGGAFAPIHVKTNSEGYASPNYKVTAEPKTERIIFLGNSFTRGFEVDHNKKFTSLVETKMKDESLISGIDKYEVMNFGIGGYNFVDQFFVYTRYARKYHPNVVALVTYLPYDLMSSEKFLDRRNKILKTDIGKLEFSDLLAGETFVSSGNVTDGSITDGSTFFPEVYRFGRRIFLAVEEKLYRLGFVQNVFVKNIAGYTDDTWAYMDTALKERQQTVRFAGDLIAKLADAVAKDNGKFMLVIIPSYWQVDNKYTQKVYEANKKYDLFLSHKILGDKIGSKFPILDLSKSVAEAINQKGAQVFIRDTGHFTGEGHILAAEEIYNFLKYDVFKVN